MFRVDDAKSFVIFCNLPDVLSEVTRLPAPKKSMTVHSSGDCEHDDQVDNDYDL